MAEPVEAAPNVETNPVIPPMDATAPSLLKMTPAMIRARLSETCRTEPMTPTRDRSSDWSSSASVSWNDPLPALDFSFEAVARPMLSSPQPSRCQVPTNLEARSPACSTIPLTSNFTTTMLQGDGWRGFQLLLFESGQRRSVRGLILSNSCDVDPTNPREVPARVVFAPLVKLAAFKALLDVSGIGAERVAAKIEAIKAQKTTNIFYLPAGGPLEESYVVRFDEAQSMPVAAHIESPDRQKLFTLSNTGFYMLVLKLSVHFCRLQERVNRKPAEGTA